MHPEDFNSRYITTTSGNNYFLVDQAPISYRGELNSAPTILLLHGFPDSWWGWRYQIKAFSSRGYRVLCPSMLGYAGSSSPIQVEKYSYKSIAYDMNSLLDQCGVKGQAYVIGHDWGGMASWRFCNYFPERVKAIAWLVVLYFDFLTPSLLMFTRYPVSVLLIKLPLLLKLLSSQMKS